MCCICELARGLSLFNSSQLRGQLEARSTSDDMDISRGVLNRAESDVGQPESSMQQAFCSVVHSERQQKGALI